MKSVIKCRFFNPAESGNLHGTEVGTVYSIYQIPQTDCEIKLKVYEAFQNQKKLFLTTSSSFVPAAEAADDKSVSISIPLFLYSISSMSSS